MPAEAEIHLYHTRWSKTLARLAVLAFRLRMARIGHHLLAASIERMVVRGR